MTATPSPSPSPSVLGEQLAYYRAVAGEYHSHTLDVPGQQELISAIRLWAPTGDVLELACGTGLWTQLLVGSAGVASVTALDGAPEMLTQAEQRLRALGSDITVSGSIGGPSYWGSGGR